MKLHIKECNLISCPVVFSDILHAGSDYPYYFEVSDDFIRDFKIELKESKQSNYTTHLIRLIMKADHGNKIKLSKLYPFEVLTIWAYQNIPEFHKQLEIS